MSRFVASESSDDKPLKDPSLNKIDTNLDDKPLKLFSMYRRGDISEDHDENQRTDSDKPQFDGIVFRSGKCVISWNTSATSVAVFDDFEQLMKIHGHDKPGVDDRYESEIVWYDIAEEKK